MDRRGFIQAGAGALIGGWFGFQAKPAQARPEGVLAPLFEETAETWNLGPGFPAIPVMMIRMTLPFAEAGLVFQKGIAGTRYIVPRYTHTQLDSPNSPYAPVTDPRPLETVLRQRMTQVMDNWQQAKTHSPVFPVFPAPKRTATSVYGVCLIVDSPKGTDYGVAVAAEDCFHKEHMRLTVPAQILFG